MLHRGRTPYDIMAELTVSLPTIYAIRRRTHPHIISGKVVYVPNDPDLEYWRVDPETLAAIEKREAQEALIDDVVDRLEGATPFEDRERIDERMEREVNTRKRKYIASLNSLSISMKRTIASTKAHHKQMAGDFRVKFKKRRDALIAQAIERVDLELGQEQEDFNYSLTEAEDFVRRRYIERFRVNVLDYHEETQRADNRVLYGIEHMDCECHPYIPLTSLEDIEVADQTLIATVHILKDAGIEPTEIIPNGNPT